MGFERHSCDDGRRRYKEREREGKRFEISKCGVFEWCGVGPWIAFEGSRENLGRCFNEQEDGDRERRVSKTKGQKSDERSLSLSGGGFWVFLFALEWG